MATSVKMQTIAYLLNEHFNDSDMLGGESRKAANDTEREFFDWRYVKDGKQHPATCPKCGRKTDPDYIDPNFKLTKKSLDIGATYDGYTIVSAKFKAFCENQRVQGIEFVVLPSQPKHYRLAVRNVLEIDTQKSDGLRLLYYCDRCKHYAGVFGTSDLRFRNVAAPLAQGLYRSDLEFAQAHEQSPLTIVGIELAAAMKAAKLRGLSLEPIEYP